MNHDQCSVKMLKNSIIAVMKEEVRLVEDLILDTEINVYELEKLLSVANNMCRNEHGVGNRRTTNLAVHLISSFGADVDIENKDGRTPLIVAIGRGSISLVRSLINIGADVNKRETSSNKTPLEYARTHEFLKDTVRTLIVRTLLRAGAQ
jgi:ankyrin repeat protein